MEKEEIINRLKDLVKYLDLGYMTTYNALMLNLNKIDKKMVDGIYLLMANEIEKEFLNPSTTSKAVVANTAKQNTLYTLLNSSNWEDRLKGEYYELSERVKNLKKCITKINAGTIDFKGKTELKALNEQLRIMLEYKSILEYRLEKEGIQYEMK